MHTFVCLLSVCSSSSVYWDADLQKPFFLIRSCAGISVYVKLMLIATSTCMSITINIHAESNVQRGLFQHFCLWILRSTTLCKSNRKIAQKWQKPLCGRLYGQQSADSCYTGCQVYSESLNCLKGEYWKLQGHVLSIGFVLIYTCTYI